MGARAPGLRVTASIGVASTEVAGDLEALVSLADQRLYNAKRAGPQLRGGRGRLNYDPRMTAFDGFGPKVKRSFQDLEADNSRNASPPTATSSGGDPEPMEALLTELSQKLGGEVKTVFAEPDIRFSRDKSPYKTNAYGIVHG